MATVDSEERPGDRPRRQGSRQEGPRAAVVPGKNRVIVEGVNMIKRHTRPNPQKNIKGGIVEREARDPRAAT